MVRVERLHARAYRVPTEAPEGDGTLSWAATTLVVVEVSGGGEVGIGWSYGSEGAVAVATSTLRDVVVGSDACAVRAANRAMVDRVRNLGAGGVAAQAIAAVDIAMWDLKGHLLDQPVAVLLDSAHRAVPVYGSGGFVTDDRVRLQQQLGGWARDGLRAVKMKVGTPGNRDRLMWAREAIGPDVALMIDANGAFQPKTALAFASAAAEHGVVWFEEPVSSDDLHGLRLVREQGPPGMEIAAGEYGWRPVQLRRMLEAGAVDVLQIDATRYHGFTGFLSAAAVAEAYGVPLSTHTAPALHATVGCAVPGLRHVEWFFDHARIESMLFDGAPVPADGGIGPHWDRPGLGMALKWPDAERYAL